MPQSRQELFYTAMMAATTTKEAKQVKDFEVKRIALNDLSARVRFITRLRLSAADRVKVRNLLDQMDELDGTNETATTA